MDNTFLKKDCDSILSEIKDEENRIRAKRRWLLGLPESEKQTPGNANFLESEFLPESLLREDDIFYETVKSRIEEGFGFCKNETVQQNESNFCTKELVRKLGLNLDSLTTKGLYLIAMIVTGGSTSFDKTRPKMKKLIKESISRDSPTGKPEIAKQLHQVLSDPGNFRKMTLATTTHMFQQSHRQAAMKVLSELDELSTQTLLAMKRKLKGSRRIPRLKTSRCGQSRRNLINQVRRASEKMLSELPQGDRLPEKLAQAMSLVDLSRKVSPGHYKTMAATEFLQFSAETKNLQNEIVKAVWLLREKVRFHEVKRLHLLLDPEAKVSEDSLRSAVGKMLIEYLFECSDMDTIPDSLTEALSLVNRSPCNVEHKVFPKEAIEEEIECVLNVSAQVKQMLWQCDPRYELDQDFGDAYMEEVEASDDDDDVEYCSLFKNNVGIKLQDKDPQNYATDSYDSDQEESGAECSFPDSDQEETSQHCLIRRLRPTSLYVTPAANVSTLISDIGTSKTRVKVGGDTEMEEDNQIRPGSLFSVENIQSDDDHGEQNSHTRNKNQYLAVQEISDETSLVAHNLIGRLVEKFADREGLHLEADERSYLGGISRLQEDVEASDEKQASSHEKSDESIIVSVVKELMPSLEKSVLKRLKDCWR